MSDINVDSVSIKIINNYLSKEIKETYSELERLNSFNERYKKLLDRLEKYIQNKCTHPKTALHVTRTDYLVSYRCTICNKSWIPY